MSKICGFKQYPDCVDGPMGAINWLPEEPEGLVTVPLICWLSSALIYLQQKDTSHLHSRNLLEITAPNTSPEVHIKTSVVL